jgi:hypothetical protein
MEESAHSGARIVSASPSRWGKDGRGARLHSLRADGQVPRARTCLHAVCVCVSLIWAFTRDFWSVWKRRRFQTTYIEHILPSTDQYTFNLTRPSNPTGRKNPLLVRCQPFRFLGKVGTARHCVARQPAPAACTCSLHLQPAPAACTASYIRTTRAPPRPINWTRPTLPAA